MSIVAHAPAPVKAIAPAVLDVAGSPHQLGLRFDAIGISWRLVQPGSNRVALVYQIGAFGRPKRFRCTCPSALITRVDDELQNDDCPHVEALDRAGLLVILGFSIHPPMPIRGGAPEAKPERSAPTEQDWEEYHRDGELQALRDTVETLLR